MDLQNKDDVDGFKNLPVFKIRIEPTVFDLERTRLLNVGKIAKGVRRPGYVLTIFLRMELDHFAWYDMTTGIGLMEGRQDAIQLSAAYEKFVKQFVECHDCGSQDTYFRITESELGHKCGACGFISEVDMLDKFKQMIRRYDNRRKERMKEKTMMKKKEREGGEEEQSEI